MNGVSLGTGLTVARVTLADTLTTYTGNTPQTGDCYPKVDTEVATIVTAMVKVQAAVYDSATAVAGTGDITLSNGATQTISATGRVTA